LECPDPPGSEGFRTIHACFKDARLEPPHPIISGSVDLDEAVSERQPIEKSPHILVVDDNDDNRYTLTLYLELEGYTNIESAHDGEEAIARLESALSISSCSMS
jgi:hypothetical protein